MWTRAWLRYDTNFNCFFFKGAVKSINAKTVLQITKIFCINTNNSNFLVHVFTEIWLCFSVIITNKGSIPSVTPKINNCEKNFGPISLFCSTGGVQFHEKIVLLAIAHYRVVFLKNVFGKNWSYWLELPNGVSTLSP